MSTIVDKLVINSEKGIDLDRLSAAFAKLRAPVSHEEVMRATAAVDVRKALEGFLAGRLSPDLPLVGPREPQR